MTRRPWKTHPARRELHALYKETDALLAPYSCPASGDCCHFARTGREPYPHAIELAELLHAARAANVVRAKRSLPIARSAARAPMADDERRCPLLGDDGRCRVYASRPFGCRSFFCDRVDGPGKVPRDELAAIGRRIADLSARAFPLDPGPRALTRAIIGGSHDLG